MVVFSAVYHSRELARTVRSRTSNRNPSKATSSVDAAKTRKARLETHQSVLRHQRLEQAEEQDLRRQIGASVY
jgi:hypothetical protein